jgi:hypothetical protein
MCIVHVRGCFHFLFDCTIRPTTNRIESPKHQTIWTSQKVHTRIWFVALWSGPRPDSVPYYPHTHHCYTIFESLQVNTTTNARVDTTVRQWERYHCDTVHSARRGQRTACHHRECCQCVESIARIHDRLHHHPTHRHSHDSPGNQCETREACTYPDR